MSGWCHIRCYTISIEARNTSVIPSVAQIVDVYSLEYVFYTASPSQAIPPRRSRILTRPFICRGISSVCVAGEGLRAWVGVGVCRDCLKR